MKLFDSSQWQHRRILLCTYKFLSNRTEWPLGYSRALTRIGFGKDRFDYSKRNQLSSTACLEFNVFFRDVFLMHWFFHDDHEKHQPCDVHITSEIPDTVKRTFCEGINVSSVGLRSIKMIYPDLSRAPRSILKSLFRSNRMWLRWLLKGTSLGSIHCKILWNQDRETGNHADKLYFTSSWNH